MMQNARIKFKVFAIFTPLNSRQLHSPNHTKETIAPGKYFQTKRLPVSWPKPWPTAASN
jgi:hypothetical protein